MTHQDKVRSLKKILQERKIDYFLLPNSDEFFSEYLPKSEQRVDYLTGFTGSNAVVIFSPKQSYFFTDGRYILQAKDEIDVDEFEIINIAYQSVLSWIKENCKPSDRFALDPQLNSLNFVNACQQCDVDLTLLEDDMVSLIWESRQAKPASPIFLIDAKISGCPSTEKRKQITQNADWDCLVITDPSCLCWLLNIRAADVDYTPLLLAYGILFKDGQMDLFIDASRCENKLTLDNVTLINPTDFKARLHALRAQNHKVQIDPASTNYWVYQLLMQHDFDISLQKDPCLLPKSCKNAAEISGMIQAHEVDGVAVTKFLCWLENNQEIDELSAEKKLLELRQESDDFLYPSFRSISSFASNGAIIHYHSEQETNKKFEGDSLYLIDSGGQYCTARNNAPFAGTTDITRVIPTGTPSAEMIEDYTRVLKGHIALARARFPKGTTGAQLDVLARSHLWKAGKDYDHGTGHGVGSFLSVHEGPCNISKRSHQALLEGMVISNEPGFYKEGEYGIRIENLMLVEPATKDGFLQFRTLTLAPLDHRLIDFKMMTYPEKKWMKQYHQRVVDNVGNGLNEDERKWLHGFLQAY